MHLRLLAHGPQEETRRRVTVQAHTERKAARKAADQARKQAQAQARKK
jgi:hypothetical protein